MLGIKANKENAQRLKVYLKTKKLLDKRHKIIVSKDFITFPLVSTPTKRALSAIVKQFNVTIARADFSETLEKTGYRTRLLAGIGKKNYDATAKGYDLLGNIAVIDAGKGVAKKIAGIIMRLNGNVETVVRKGGAVKGKYRTRDYKYVAGKKNYIATYRENGCTFKFDIRKTFFSSRLAFERNRVANLAKENEKVVVMFAGVGPFAVEIAKRVPSASVVAIELNKEAYKSLLENIKLNKVANVTAELGDVHKIAIKHRHFAGRIIMPLPKDSYNFLDAALTCSKNNATVHYYAFADINNPFREHEQMITNFFKSKGKHVKFIFRRIVRSYSGSEVEIVLDFALESTR